MSGAFGYGSSYDTANPAQSGRGYGQGNPQTMPGFSGQPGGFQNPLQPQPMYPTPVQFNQGKEINWNPDANDPWKTQYDPVYGGVRRSANPGEIIARTSAGMAGLGAGAFHGFIPGSNYTGVVGQQIRPFRNVLDVFNGENSLLGPSKEAMSSNFNPNVGWRGDAYQVGADAYGNPIYGSPNSGVGPTKAPSGTPASVRTFADLQKQIDSLSADRLNQLDYDNQYHQQFQSAADNLANAWANKDYAALYSKAFPGASQEQASNWLQSSYNSMQKKLDDSWLL